MFSGQLVDPFDLKPSEVRIDDIAWALSNICRYGGHYHRNYSVAEHTLLVAGLLPPHKKLYALLHDAPEAYLGDIPTPLKRRMPQFKELETKVARVVAEAFDLDPDEFLTEIETGDVKQADLLALKYEQSYLWKNNIPSPDRQERMAKELYLALWTETPHFVGHPAHPFFVTCY
jgi:uncharacterized protein